MSFPSSSTPTSSPQTAALSLPISLTQTTRDPGPSDVSYTPGQSEWLNTSNGNYWKYKGVQIVSGNAQAVWTLLTTVSETRDPTSSDNIYTVGTLWSNTSTNAFWALTSYTGTLAQWEDLTSNPSPGGVLQLTPQDLNVVLPNGSGNINISGGTSGFLETVRSSTDTLTIRESGFLNVIHGGTGAPTLAANGVLIGQGNATIHVTTAGSSGAPLLAGGLGTDPDWGNLSVPYGGTGLTSVAAHYLMVGNGSSDLNVIAPSATSGVPLISQGASADPIYGTAAIAGGGTNATSFTQSHGIVVYDGTSLVNYAGPQISTAGVQTNTSQPCFFGATSIVYSNVTGDGTNYPVICETEIFDQTNSYNPTTGVFTCPVSGKYYFNVRIPSGGLGGGMTKGAISLTINSGAAVPSFAVNNPLATVDGDGIFEAVMQYMINLSANDTVQPLFQIAGGAKTVSVNVGAIIQGWLVV